MFQLSGVFANLQSLVQRQRNTIAVTCPNPSLNSRWIDVNTKKHSAVKRGGKWLGATHTAHAARPNQPTGQITAKLLVRHGRKCLKCSLNDALRSNVDPTASSHLPVLHRLTTSFLMT